MPLMIKIITLMRSAARQSAGCDVKKLRESAWTFHPY